jgi:hypothetical protein
MLSYIVTAVVSGVFGFIICACLVMGKRGDILYGIGTGSNNSDKNNTNAM